MWCVLRHARTFQHNHTHVVQADVRQLARGTSQRSCGRVLDDWPPVVTPTFRVPGRRSASDGFHSSENYNVHEKSRTSGVSLLLQDRASPYCKTLPKLRKLDKVAHPTHGCHCGRKTHTQAADPDSVCKFRAVVRSLLSIVVLYFMP